MKNLFLGVLAVGAMLMAIGIASAQTVDLQVDKTLANGDGQFIATLDQISATQWSVTSITGDPANVPDTGADLVTLSFYTDTSQKVADNIVSVTGTGGLNTDSPAYTKWGSGNYGFGPNVYEWAAPVNPVTHMVFDTLNSTGNSFGLSVGSVITLSSAAQAIDIETQNSNNYEGDWIAPETSSWVLLLAALVPLGLIAWRRRSSASNIGAV